MLEPYDGKLSRTVLRREWSRKAPDLSGTDDETEDTRSRNDMQEEYLNERILRHVACQTYTAIDAVLRDPAFRKRDDLSKSPLRSEEYIAENLRKEYRPNNEYVLNVSDEMEEELFKVLFGDESVSHIYHYTSFDALTSIMNSRKLRFSSVIGLNDASELNYGIGLTRRYSGDGNLEKANTSFVLSASTREDDINQWRLYGENGKGVCIKLGLIRERLGENFKFLHGRIFYGDRLFSQFNDLINNLLKRKKVFLAFWNLFDWENMVKNVDFKDEDEYRILFFNKYPAQPKGVPKSYLKDTVWQRNRHGVLCPYVEFDLNNFEVPVRIEGVVIGPNVRHSELNKVQLERFLDSRFIKDVEVSISKKVHLRD